MLNEYYKNLESWIFRVFFREARPLEPWLHGDKSLVGQEGGTYCYRQGYGGNSVRPDNNISFVVQSISSELLPICPELFVYLRHEDRSTDPGQTSHRRE